MKIFEYVRVSSKEQNVVRQIETMKAEGIGERDMFIDKLRRKDFNRQKYQLLKQIVREGDTVVFDSITRMGRNMNETMSEYDWFVKNGVQQRFIKEPMINTSNEQEDIIKLAIQKIILTLLRRKEMKSRQGKRRALQKQRRRGSSLVVQR
ncbi:recombinase family protein [Peribacillus simplex]|uniref:Recombinase family protein n=1 Tax=Peribacillus simplex TaxID=1478 RepID=A0A9X8ZD14_9BACI|nr:recombinase family protein [Peribacillus simplex]TKH06574.1 recombinase family protein [Peribacillus simplex]